MILTNAQPHRLDPNNRPRQRRKGAVLATGVSDPTREQVLTWRTQRICEPADAWLVYEVAKVDPSVLPRWHQDDRGRRATHRGFHVTAPDGAYSRIAAWRNRDHWLSFVVATAIGLRGGLLRQHGVSITLLRRLLRVKAAYAHSNGRRVIVRPDVLASVLGCSKRQVQRMTACARDMGLEAVVMLGRMLTHQESTDARKRGSSQRGLSTESALTVPSVLHHVGDLVTPTRGITSPNNLTIDSGHHGAASGESKDGASRRAPKKRSRKVTPGLQLAREAVRRVAWLVGEAPGRLTPSLERFACATHRWTASDLVTALVLRDQRLGLAPPVADAIRTRPAVVLAKILSELDPYADHPRLMDLEGPCERPDCDGHGWITTPRGVAKCPECPSYLRANPSHVEEPEF